MRSVLEERVEDARAIERRLRQGTDKIVSQTNFPVVAKVLWPTKTAACLAAIAGVDERSAWRWLSGEHDPPICIVIAVVEKTFGK